MHLHLSAYRDRLPYFNPHAARHYLASVRDEYCRNPEQRKAWSYNLGHKNEQITETNYAKMTDQRRDEVFGGLCNPGVLNETDKDLLLAYHERRLCPGTPKYERAQRLFDERLKRKLADSGDLVD